MSTDFPDSIEPNLADFWSVPFIPGLKKVTLDNSNLKFKKDYIILNEEETRMISNNLPKIEGLERLTIGNIVCESDFIKYIFESLKYCESLHYIHLKGVYTPEVIRALVQSLKEMKNMKTLKIKKNMQISAFKYMFEGLKDTTIENLIFGKEALSSHIPAYKYYVEAILDNIGDMKNLKHFKHNLVCSNYVEILKLLPKQRMIVSRPDILDKIVKEDIDLSAVEELECTWIASVEKAELFASSLSHFTNIKILNLSSEHYANYSLTDDTLNILLPQIEKMKQLEVLDLSRNNFGQETLVALYKVVSKLPNMKKLILYGALPDEIKGEFRPVEKKEGIQGLVNMFKDGSLII